MEASSAITRFRKTALKARHKSQLDHAKLQIEKEVEQSINEMKLQLEVNRLKAVEKQVRFKRGNGERKVLNRIQNYLYLHAIQYNTIQYNTIQYNTIQYNTIQYNNTIASS